MLATLGRATSQQLLASALVQLDRAHLLATPLPAQLARGARADVLVTTLAAPSALAAASKCFRIGQPCVHHFNCCSTFCNSSGRCA